MTTSQPPAGPSSSQGPGSTFGANEWLVDDLYQQYLVDKQSVDPAWWEFFADSQTPETNGKVARHTETPVEKGPGTTPSRPSSGPTAPEGPASPTPPAAPPPTAPPPTSNPI